MNDWQFHVKNIQCKDTCKETILGHIAEHVTSHPSGGQVILNVTHHINAWEMTQFTTLNHYGHEKKKYGTDAESRLEFISNL